jgi:FAD/FMN-containing dehydrogenase
MASGSIGDGVIVDLSRMREIGAVDVERKRIHVQPGAVWLDVESVAHTHGLRIPPDPSSGTFATIGGMVSTNAAGAHTLKYGAMRRWVTALDCIFDDGSRATIARGEPLPSGIPALDRFARIAGALRDDADATVHAGLRKNSSGYGVHAYAQSGELVDLLVGSEGTLVIVVGIELQLAELPGATSSLLGAFPTLEGAVASAVQARDAGAAACELLDRTFLDVAARGHALPDVPAGTEAVLLAEVEGDDADDAARRAQSLAAAFRSAGASSVSLALTPDDEEHLWELRHAASPILATLGASLTSMQFIEDGAVPPERLPDYVRGIREILRAHDVPGVIFGHAGDSHVHVNPLVDVTRENWQETVQSMLDDAVALTARLGGTLDAEHGDGRLRTPLLSRVWSDAAMRTFRLVKETFDPAGIFNPGVKVPLPNERAIVDVKYDPALAPHPPRAARALAHVAAKRAYSEDRLALLERFAAS